MSWLKHFLFRWYGAVAIAACGAIAVFGIQPWAAEYRSTVVLSAFGAVLSFAYFVQKQKLEELTLFSSLFSEFNKRYDALNGPLAAILRGDVATPLTDAERNVLVDYFNLCAEEYLYYEQGFILRQVWKSWYNGMKTYYRNDRIGTLWRKELESQSYYGLELVD